MIVSLPTFPMLRCPPETILLTVQRFLAESVVPRYLRLLHVSLFYWTNLAHNVKCTAITFTWQRQVDARAQLEVFAVTYLDYAAG